MTNVGFFYDFDLTLSEDFQQFPLVRKFMRRLKKEHGIERPEQYWRLCDEAHLKLGWLQQFVRDCQSGVFPEMTNDRIRNEFGPLIQLSPGLPEWFERINHFGSGLGLDVTHHVISSGAKPFIEGTIIFPYLTTLVAGDFIEDGVRIDGVKDTAGSFEKVEAIKRISKGGDIYVDQCTKDYFIGFRKLFVFGDGQTDRSMFRYAREAGGRPIAVYERGSRDAFDKTVSGLQGDVVAILPRDYSEGFALDVSVKEMLTDLAENECDIDADLVQRLHFGQIVHDGVRDVVQNHYDSCGYCQRRRELKVVFG